VLDGFVSDFASAQARYEEAATIWRELGNLRGLSLVSQNLATVYESIGDLDGAAAMLEESVELARAVANPAHLASTLETLGGMLARRGDAARAVPLVRESLEISRGVGADVTAIECLETLAHVAARGDDAVTGATLLGVADAYRDASGAVRQPDDQPFVDTTVAALQAALGADALAVAMERGRRTELADAVEIGLRVTPAARPARARPARRTPR